VPLPFGEGSGERAYRTGDRVRWLAGGTVEFLGRFDHQVKLRGFRIELGEIEAVLLGTGWVRECVVLVREGSGGDKQLVGWVVWEGQRRPFSQLREWLGERLPEHMVPARWIELGSLPLTPNGKVDRKALPEPGGGLGEEAGEEQGAAPEGWVEELVAGVWCEVLDLARVGRGASFFELGGHSLLATRVVARLRETLGLEVPLRELFERPTLVALAAGLEERLREAGGWHRPALAARPGVEAGVRRSGEADQLPLSWAQERLWFLEQWEPGGSVYNVPLALRLTGDLSVAALLASLGAVEERHQSLRTRFAGGGESAWQEVVAARRPWPLPVVDVSGLPARSAEGEARRLMQQDMERGFDLARGPLWRGLLVRLGAAEHGLLLVVHHIASDGWSLGVLTRELVALYQAGGDAAAAGLAPLPVQYGDYALWQRSWLSGELLASELAWWRQRLAGWGGLLELPWDRPRPAVRSSAGSALSFAVPAAVVGTLRGWGRRQGATLFMMLLGALQALLARLAGTERLVVGTPVAGRTERSTEDLIGFFVNTLVVRGDLAGSPTVAELWGRVREELLAAWSHQEVPFEKLVAELEPERSPSFTPLFQVSFVLQNAPRQGRGVAGLALSSWEWRRWSAKFDLTWAAVEEEGGGVRVAVEYATALFDRTTVERWGRSWATLLAAMADGPERPLAALPWLSAAERWQLLGEWNDSATASPSSPTVLDLFDHTLERCPERLALLEGEEHWSFSGLVRRSDGIAAWLQRSGAGPEAIVALLLPRSIDNVVATLGVARAGLAYLPVDPAYPDERVEYMVRDSGAWAILTSAELAPRAAGCGALCLAVDRLDAAGASPAPGRSWSVSPEHLAYVIYTSGSTGRPKGVEIQHGGLMNLVSWYQRVYAIAPEDRATLVAGPAFDASVFELWPCLLAGASLAIPAAEELTSARGLHRWLAERAVSVCFLPTPLAMSVLEEPPPALSRLRILMTAGDRLTRVGDAPPPFELYNLYGPTENTVAATSGRVAGACFAGRLPDLGRPIANVWTLVLDRGLEPVAAGVPGELWLGGRSLARGYRRRPGLTADRFRPDPFGATPGDRLYRTGDLVRWLASGVLDFLGRADAQVKIRGFRIELGEIEAVLRRCPLVVDCALDLRLGPPGDQRLVAYVVPSDAGSWSPPSLREHLARELPEYMVPGEWVQLSELPLTPNGKVDRRRLPAPAWGATGDERALSAPRDRFEIELTQLWQELFGREPIALEDDFFALGGHSLLALRLRSRIEKHFGQTLPVAALFEAPTIEQLARWLRREGQPARGRSLLVTFRSEGEALPLFLVHGAGGGVVDFASLAHALGGKQPVYGLQAPGIDGEPLAAPTIQQLAELHLGALRAVQPAGPYRLAGWSMGGLVALEIARLLCRQGEPIAQLCLLDSAPGPVLARAPRHRDDDLRDFARHLGITVGANTQELFGAALESGDLGVLLELAHRHRLLPPDVGLTDLERRLEVYRGNVEAALAYRAEPYPEPVLLVLAGEGAIARNGWLAAWEPSLPRAEVRIVAGDHFGMLQEPGVTELATLLRGVEKS
ncbi:MAG TPA: amino acid adenylation domain-containing protein, partial [Thermoanaerobaculia bacterium]|nr:amino acid adenylation domain-containing protein [Thermoanaerobaculia bacterium]